MTNIAWISVLPWAVGYVLIGAGIGALWTAWRHRAASRWLVGGGWMAIVAGFAILARIGDGERGIALGGLMFMGSALMALGPALAGAAETGRSARARQRAPRVAMPRSAEPHTSLYQAGLAGALGVASGLAALFLALAIYELAGALDATPANRIGFAFIIWPVSWAFIAVDLLLERRHPARRAAALVFSCAAAWLALRFCV